MEYQYIEQSPEGITRRQVLLGAGAIILAAAGCGTKNGEASSIMLPDLPYAQNALEPVISARTLEFHYGKHHQGYVNKLNTAIEGTPMEGMSLEEIIAATANDAGQTGVFNNAAQVWNHSLYWRSLKPGGSSMPAELTAAIEQSFGSVDDFKSQLAQAAGTQFGSGWAWLCVKDDGGLAVKTTPNQDNPISEGIIPILGLDVWEHAYYLKYENRRPDYIGAWWNVVDWDFVAANLGLVQVGAGIDQAADWAKAQWSKIEEGWSKLGKT